VPSDRLQHRADGLAARVEALAEALRASGVPDEASSRLLSQAATAVLQTLNLELLLESSRSSAPRVPGVRSGRPHRWSFHAPRSLTKAAA
jgi:hypothetical protein